MFKPLRGIYRTGGIGVLLLNAIRLRATAVLIGALLIRRLLLGACEAQLALLAGRWRIYCRIALNHWSARRARDCLDGSVYRRNVYTRMGRTRYSGRLYRASAGGSA